MLPEIARGRDADASQLAQLLFVQILRAQMKGSGRRDRQPEGQVRLPAVRSQGWLPAPERHALAPIRFAADDDGLSERLSALGHAMVSPNEADVFVTGDIDAARVEAIHSGQRVLQIVAKDPGRLRDDTPPRDGPMSIEIDAGGGGMLSGPYFSFPGYGLVNRHKSIWRGDWVGNFSWLRRDGVFAHIPGGPLFDMSFTGVVPHQLMTGFRP
ncbi:hypothetical protein OS035_06410 [Rhizobium sp. 268]|uniref:hypothetical protein n=1 Tax=Rhizobium sp. 268 TaxID=2996375 RepID=UPI002F95E566